MDPLEGIATFAAVVEAQSFSGAARDLNRSKAAVSSQIQRLEDRLGVRLLHRTTRRLSMTDEGRAYYEHARRIMDEARDAEDALENLSAEPRGVLRLNAPMSFGIRHLGGAVAEFMQRHPDVEVDLVLNDRQVDLVEDGFDMGIRIARLGDSSLIARRVAPCRRIVVASPEYWKRRGKPEHPDDLKDHDILLYSYLAEPGVWSFKGPEGPITVNVDGRLRANNGDVLLEAAKEGLGVDLVPTFFCCDELMDGSLEPALLEYEDDPIFIYAVYPHRRHVATRVRVFVDFLADRLGEHPYWDAWAESGVLPIEF
jgi:DNA-binding transcriptional LysR family regulator